MMSAPEKHLTDEELIAMRDGACRDPERVVHVENCDYCQAMLDEWRKFQAKLSGANAASSASRLDHDIDTHGEADEPRVFHNKSAVDSYSPDSASLGYEFLPAPPTPPAFLLDTALKSLRQRPARKSLGALTLYLTEDAELHMETDAGALTEAGETVYAVGDCRLHISLRQAGFATMLVARLSGDWMTGHGDEYDITLVSARGVVRAQPLLRDSMLARGMAWFPVPHGESELLIHLDRTWQLRVRQVFPGKV